VGARLRPIPPEPAMEAVHHSRRFVQPRVGIDLVWRTLPPACVAARGCHPDPRRAPPGRTGAPELGDGCTLI